jgi:hypothetical protein
LVDLGFGRRHSRVGSQARFAGSPGCVWSVL